MKNTTNKYRIGQKVSATDEIEWIDLFDGLKHAIPKDAEGWVAADYDLPFVRLKTGESVVLDRNRVEISGCDPDGLAEWIFVYLNTYLLTDSILEEIEEMNSVTSDEIKEIISSALQELGFYRTPLD